MEINHPHEPMVEKWRYNQALRKIKALGDLVKSIVRSQFDVVRHCINTIAKRDATIRERDVTIAELERKLEEQEEHVARMSKLIAECHDAAFAGNI